MGDAIMGLSVCVDADIVRLVKRFLFCPPVNPSQTHCFPNMLMPTTLRTLQSPLRAARTPFPVLRRSIDAQWSWICKVSPALSRKPHCWHPFYQLSTFVSASCVRCGCQDARARGRLAGWMTETGIRGNSGRDVLCEVVAVHLNSDSNRHVSVKSS